jgi:hypothetical protein
MFLAASPLAGQGITVEVQPARATILAGSRLQFTATVRDAAGREVTGRRVAWSVMPDDVASIDTSGMLTGHHQGATEVRATLEGVTGTARAVIEAKDVATVEFESPPELLMVGGQVVLTAVARTDDGEPLRGAVFSFRSSDDRVAAVDPVGVVTGRGEGIAFLVATSGRMRAELRLKVVANRLSRLTISGPVTGRTGEVIRLRAAGEDGRMLPVRELAVNWSVAGSGAEIGVDGAFVAERPGTYLVTASAGPVAASHSIRVTQRPATRVLDAVRHVALPGYRVTSVGAHGTTAWVTTRPARVVAFDLSDPAHPARSDSLVVNAAAVSRFVTTTDGAIGVVAMEGATAARNGVLVLDLSSPLHPKVLAERTGNFNGGVTGLAIQGGNLFVTSGDGVLRVISLTDPTRPVDIGRYILGGSSDGLTPNPGKRFHNVHVTDGVVYLASGRDGLVILDVGNGIGAGTPEHPKLVGQFVYDLVGVAPSGFKAGTHAVVRSGRYAFVADEVVPGDADPSAPERVPSRGRVHIVDVANVLHPVLVGEFGLPDAGSRDLAVSGDFLLGAFGEGGVRVLDLSGGELRGDLLAQGRELGTLWTGSPSGFLPNLPGAVSVRALGDLIVVGDANSGVWIARLVTPPPPE